MSHVRQTSLPQSEPVSLQEAKNFCRVSQSFTDDDSLLSALITAARQYGETQTGKCLAQRTWEMVLDSHPYYTDTVQSQLAYPPSYYSLPKYSTTLWNYSQQIKLPYPPLKSVDGMRYVGTDGVAHTMYQDLDFTVDRISEPARIFPNAGQYWPADLYTPNAVLINFTSGFDPSPAAAADTHTAGAVITNVSITNNVLTIVANNNFTAGQSITFVGVKTATFLNGQSVSVGTASASQFTANFSHANYASAADSGTAALTVPGQQPDSIIVLAVPQTVRTAILMLTGHWYFNREPVASGGVASVPNHVNELLWSNAVVDFQPTRG